MNWVDPPYLTIYRPKPFDVQPPEIFDALLIFFFDVFFDILFDVFLGLVCSSLGTLFGVILDPLRIPKGARGRTKEWTN